MKRFFVFLIFLSVCFTSLLAQENVVTGTWYGLLRLPVADLRITIHVEGSDSGYRATMDSPDQNAFGLAMTSFVYDKPNVIFEAKKMLIKYSGILDKDSIMGTFTQGGSSFTLNFGRSEILKKSNYRPQEPKPPYPYHVEEVKFTSAKSDLTLCGTLTIPVSNTQKSFPAVVLISGSGPQNRDEELFNHKPFWVIADYLTKQGIAVLRYDDRGTAKSGGNFNSATTMDFADDALGAVNYLKGRGEVDRTKIGLVGHSEGGLIAPMVAVEDKDVRFIVLLAAPGITGDKLLLLQQELIGLASGINSQDLQKMIEFNRGSFDIILKHEKDTTNLRSELRDYIESKASNQEKGNIESILNTLVSPWFTFLLSYDPAPTLERVKCAVLALNGEKDLQVPYKIDLDAIDKALKEGGNSQYVVKSFPSLNHLFQKCETGSVKEYAEIEETISPDVLKYIKIWIQEILL